MFYFVFNSYEPHSAATNRIVGYLKYLSKVGVDTHVVFLYPNGNRSRLNMDLPNINVEYLWDKHSYQLNKISQVINRYAFPKYFAKKLKGGDIVYLYGCIETMHEALRVKGVSVYHEETELLEIIGGRNRLTGFPLKKYYEDCKKLSRFFCISTCIRDFYIKRGVAPEKIEIINMTVDPTRFDGAVKDTNSAPYVAYCGQIYNNKDGVDNLLKAMAKVFKVHPEIKLYIIGRTLSVADKSTNELLLESLGITENVVLTGEVSDAEMLSLIKNARALVYNRPDNIRAQSSFPTKLGEFLMTGNPVVITAVGDIPLFLEDGVSAVMPSPGDDELFADRVIWTIEHPEESTVIGENGRKVALKHFNSAAEAKKMFDIVLN